MIQHNFITCFLYRLIQHVLADRVLTLLPFEVSQTVWDEIRYRWVSTIHAVYTCWKLSLYFLGINPSTDLQLIFINSMAYCCYDSYLIYRKHNEKEKVKFFIHHVMMLTILYLNYQHPDIDRLNA